MGTLATLMNPHGDVWHIAGGDGQHLTAMHGDDEDLVLESATVYLISDRGYPPGVWIRRGPGRYSYQTVAP